MKIPIEILNKWKGLYSKNDAERIAEKANVHTITIRRAFYHRSCNADVFKVMADYFRDKEIMINNYK